MVRTQTVIFRQRSFSERPETLLVVDIASSLGEPNPIVDGLTLPAKLKQLGAIEPVGVEDAPLF